MKTITLLLSLGLIGGVSAGDLVVKGDPALRGMNLWLSTAEKKEAEPKLPDNHVGADDADLVWKDLKPGKYVICLDPDYEDWASHCVASVPVEIGEGTKKIEIKIPSGAVDVSVGFEGVEAPKQDGTEGLIFRVEKLQNDGVVHPYIRQWLWTENKDGKLVGALEHLVVNGVSPLEFT